MSKRSPESPRSTDGPPTKVLKPNTASGDAGDLPTRARDVDRKNAESPSQDEPPTEKRGDVVGEGDAAAATATHDDMAPESSAQAGIGRKESKENGGPPDHNQRDTDVARRDEADIDLYRKHFSGYKEPRAHLSSNPYIESDQVFTDQQHRRDLAEDGKGGTYSHGKTSPSFAPPTLVTTRPSASPPHGTHPQGVFGDAQSAAERQPGESASTPRMWEGEETRGDKHGSWTERVQDLRKYAESRGADLPSMPPGSLGHATFADYDPGSLGHATSADYDPGPERRCNSRGENDVQQGVEATMALYSYPRLENGQRFFERMPEERRAELERVKTDLRYMEEQLKNATKARIEEVAATLDTGQPGARSAPPRRY